MDACVCWGGRADAHSVCLLLAGVNSVRGCGGEGNHCSACCSSAADRSRLSRYGENCIEQPTTPLHPTGLHMTFPKLRHSLQHMDDSQLSPEQLKGLMKALPTPGERHALQLYLQVWMGVYRRGWVCAGVNGCGAFVLASYTCHT